MNNGTSFIFGLAIGATVGAVTSWLLLKRTYEQITREEIDSVKEVYSRKYSIPQDNDEDGDSDILINEYHDIASDYISNEEKGGPEPMDNTRVCVIPPEELGEIREYDVITLTYYENSDILTDDMNEVIENRKEVIGEDSLEYFGVYEDDSVCVRNDDRKCYYEILMDMGEYESSEEQTDLTEEYDED